MGYRRNLWPTLPEFVGWWQQQLKRFNPAVVLVLSYTTVTPPGNVQVISQTTTKSDWLFTARPRIGFTGGQWLVYATGGLAVADIKYAQTNNYLGVVTETGAISTTKAGWTAGGGVEAMVAPNWSIKAEYLYVDLGNTSTTVANPIAADPPFSHATNLKANIARAGINYHF